MLEISGRVVIRETGVGLRDVIVSSYWAVLSDKEFGQSPGSSKLFTKLGNAISSALTNEEGVFTLRIESEERDRRQRQQLYVAVLAPDDVEDADKPFARASEQRLLFLSRPVTPEAGGRISMLIRLLQEQVKHARLGLCQPVPVGPCDDLIDALEERRKRAAQDREARAEEAARRRERSLAIKEKAKRLVGKLDALPGYMFAEGTRDSSSIIKGKAELKKQLPQLQARMIEEGLARIAKRPKAFKVMMSESQLSLLGISPDGDNANIEIDPSELAKVVHEANGGFDLVRRRESASLSDLERLWRKVSESADVKKTGGDRDGE